MNSVNYGNPHASAPPYTPKLCHHKATQQGYVTLNGRENYLGHWPRGQRTAPPAVRADYDALISRWLANGRRLPDDTTPAPDPVTVNKVVLAFVPYAEGHYNDRGRKAGKSAEAEGIKAMCKVLARQFGRLPVAEFGPRALKQVRVRMNELGWSRTYINKQVNRLKRMFRWAVAEELIPGSVLHNLSAVGAIRKGEPGIRETEPVRPVADELIAATLPFTSLQVAAMIRLQILTGARPGEIVLIRGCDIDRTGPVWVFVPEHHKTEGKGKSREVYIGPKAQAVLLPWLRDDPEAYLFSPAEAEAARRQRQRESRKTKVQPSQADRKIKDPGKVPGDRYTTMSYGKAIKAACLKADRLRREELVAAARKVNADVSAIEAAVYVPVWSPHRLRHNAGTELRKQFGIEMAQLALGHASMAATQIYAERDREKVMAAFQQAG